MENRLKGISARIQGMLPTDPGREPEDGSMEPQHQGRRSQHTVRGPRPNVEIRCYVRPTRKNGEALCAAVQGHLPCIRGSRRGVLRDVDDTEIDPHVHVRKNGGARVPSQRGRIYNNLMFMVVDTLSVVHGRILIALIVSIDERQV